MTGGFLSTYDGTTRVDLTPEYWVEVKKCLSVADSMAAEVASTAAAIIRREKAGSGIAEAVTNLANEPALFRYKEVLASAAQALRVVDNAAASASQANAGYFEQVLASVVRWSLTDENGALLPFDHDSGAEAISGRPSPRRRSLQRLPQFVLDKLIGVVIPANRGEGPDAQFRAGDPELAAVGKEPASDDSEVLVGAGVLGADGDSGGPEAADPATIP